MTLLTKEDLYDIINLIDISKKNGLFKSEYLKKTEKLYNKLILLTNTKNTVLTDEIKEELNNLNKKKIINSQNISNDINGGHSIKY